MREHLTKALEAADRDWHANVGEHDRASLDRMFKTSGFARQCPRGWDVKVPDWCGMATGTWLVEAGLNPAFARSFLHVFNVEAFFTYGQRRNVNPKRLDTKMQTDGGWVDIRKLHGDTHPRRWLDRGVIESTVVRGVDAEARGLFAPGDVVLFDWQGVNDPDHITMVKAWDGRLLTTIEGNAAGLGPAGDRRKDAVVERKTDLSKASARRLIYGAGRVSAMDFCTNAVKP